MKFNETILKQFTQEFLENEKQFVADKGLKVKLKKVSYEGSAFTMKLEFTDASVDVAKSRFEQCCILYGLDKSDYLREFIYHNERYQLYGLNTRAPKYPCLCRQISSGKDYAFPLEVIKKNISDK